MHFLRSFIDTKISTSARRRKCYGSWYPDATIVRTNHSKTRNVDGSVYTGILKRGRWGGKGVGWWGWGQRKVGELATVTTTNETKERKKGGGYVPRNYCPNEFVSRSRGLCVRYARRYNIVATVFCSTVYICSVYAHARSW